MSRADQAKAYFLSGYNCAQAVALAFADLTDYDEPQIAQLTSGFGGGIGRMREVCGSISGAAFILSALLGYSNPQDNAGKQDLYTAVQAIGNEFRRQNGSVVCRELLGLSAPGSDSPVPEPRSDAYYKKRPCHELVWCSAAILETYLNQKEQSR